MFERSILRMLFPGLALVIAPLLYAQEQPVPPTPTRVAQGGGTTTVRPAPVPRPATPQPADNEESGARFLIENANRNGEMPETIELDFSEEPLIQVIEQLAALTDLTFDIDPRVAQEQVTIISHTPVPTERAFEILESILWTRNLSIVPVVGEHLVKIMPSSDPKRLIKDDFIIGLGENIPADLDGTSTHLVSIQYADPQILADTLNQLTSGNTDIAKVDVYLPTNTLIINGTSDALRRFDTFIQIADVPGLGTQTELFFLEYTSSDVLAQQLQDLLLDNGGSETAATTVRRTTVTPVRTTTTRPISTRTVLSEPQVFGSREEVLRILSDERLNAIIAVASEGMMDQVRSFVKWLDSPVPTDRQNLHIYELLNADAESVQEALQDVVSNSGRRSGGAAGGAGGAAPAVSGNSPAFDGEVSVTRYEQTNSLLIVASAQDYKVLESFIEQLDVQQRQVYVDAVVMDVTLTDEYTVTVDAAGLTGNDGFGLTSTGNIASLMAVADTATDIASGASGIASSLLSLGGSGGMTTGIFDDITLNINGQPTQVPFVPVLFQALEKVTDIEILSQPSLSTVDNEEASIAVGQEVPFITSTSSSQRTETGQAISGSYGGYTRVQREEVGVKMTVTPQITEGDNVLLEIEIEVSGVSANQVGSVDIVGPTTDKAIIRNKVLVKDGSTAVLAGLISNTVDRSKSQAPILGDIPVLGWLFRNKNNTMRKRNMVILVTPHIMKSANDSDRVTDFRVDEYHRTNIQGLLDTGFLKKSIGKYDERKNYRPTFDRAEELTGRRSGTRFGRGDINR